MREQVAEKLYELAGYGEDHIRTFPNHAWAKIKGKDRWYKKADQILLLVKERVKKVKNPYLNVTHLGIFEATRQAILRTLEE